MSLRPRRAALRERERGDARHDDESEQRREHDRDEVATVTPRCRPLVLELAAATPAENRAREHVVEDLETDARPCALVEGPQNPLPAERAEHRFGRRLRHPGELRE